MDAIILAGGLGTRLRDTISDVPKPLAPICGKPFLDILLDQLNGHVDRIILAVGYKSDQIREYYQKGEVFFSEEKEPLGTGGALKQALAHAKRSPVLVLNGDSYFGIDLGRLAAFHEEKSAEATIACREVDDVSRYGSIFFDGMGRVTAFHEKEAKRGKGWINGGIYLISRTFLDFFSDKPFSLEQAAFPLLLNKRVFAYPSEGKFIDIGTRESYFKAQGIL